MLFQLLELEFRIWTLIPSIYPPFVFGAEVLFKKIYEHLRFELCSSRTLACNCPFQSSNEDWARVLNFHLLETGVHRKNDRIKISQFTKFMVLSLDSNHVEGFQKHGKIETLYGFGGRHLRIRDFCMEFGRPSTGHSLVTT